MPGPNRAVLSLWHDAKNSAQCAQASARQAAEASSERHAGALVGGWKEVDAGSSEVVQAAEFAVRELAQQSNSLTPPQLEEVRSSV